MVRGIAAAPESDRGTEKQWARMAHVPHG